MSTCALSHRMRKRSSRSKKAYEEQKFDSKKTDGPVSSDLQSVKASHMPIHAENSLKSDGYYKRTDRKSRIIEKSGSASKPEFEFTRLDFPELQGPENSERPETQKPPKWGPLHPAPTDISLLREVGKPAAASPESKASQGGDPEQNEASRRNKKKKEKSKSKYEVLTVQEPPRIENNFKNSGKKSQIPVQLDLGGMLTALEKKQHSQNAKQSSRPVVFSVGAVPVLSRESASGKKGQRPGPVKTPHNPLDSSAPLVKKGKQREVPKAKRPTSLKKIILKERQERKQQRLQENAVSPASAGEDAQAPAQPDPSGGSEESVSCAPVEESKSEEQPGAELQREAEARPRIHSRRFRDYCSQVLSKEVDACVTDLLKELVRFQDRMYQKDPVKAKAKRRLVLGLREVLKHLKLKKLKCVIISPNCEKIQSKGGLDDTLHSIIDHACEQNIPFVFALNRKALGRSLNKAVPVSVVGVFSYDGAQDQFHKMVELTMAARQSYKAMLENVHRELAAAPGPQAPASPPVQGPNLSTEDGPPAPAGEEEQCYIEIWRRHLEAYSRRALELETSLEASTSQMMNLNL
nr:selenocysteine insertion sequence-binding protein 2 isoform X4 [Vicugna pacos]